MKAVIDGKKIVTINRDTPIWTRAGWSAGFTLVDTFLGGQSASIYDTGHLWRKDETSTIEWLKGMIEQGEGFYLTEQECDDSVDTDVHDYYNLETESFTVASVLQTLRQMARESRN